MESRRKIRGAAALAVVTFFWGTTFTSLKFLQEGWSLFFALGLRFMTAGLIMLPFCIRGIAADPRRALKFGLVVAAVNAAAIILQTMGLWRTTASNASFITAFFVVLVPLGEGVVFRRPVSGRDYGMALTALAGVGLISFQHGSAAGVNAGDLLVLICSFFYAAQIIAVDRAVRQVPPAAVACLMFLGTGLVCLVLMPVFEVPAYSTAPGSVAWMLLLIFGGSITAYGLQAWGQARISSAKASLIYTLEPIFATLFAMMFLPGEGLNRIGLLGAALVTAALVCSAAGDIRRRRSVGVKD